MRRLVMRNKGLGVVILAAVVGLVAVASPWVSAQDGEMPSRERSVPNRDERLAEAQGAVSELGGFRYDHETSTLYLYLTDGLTDDSVRDSAVTALKESGVLRSEKATHQVEVVEVSYTVAQLLDWKMLIKEHAGQFVGQNSLGVQQQSNRIRLGVISSEHVGPIRAELSSLGIPEDAVSIEVNGLIEFQVQTEDDLQDEFLTVQGGIQTKGGGTCTVGVPLEMDGTLGYITAGHCSDNWGQGNPSTEEVTNGVTFHQPVVNQSSNEMGDETHNIHFDSNYSGCNMGDECLYSDTLFIEDSGNLTAQVGWIARPEQSSIDIDQNEDPFEVVDWDSADSVEVGDTVHKVGITTGWTNGLVEDDCEDIAGPNPWVSGETIEILCATRVGMGTSSGDSGAPMFLRNGDEVTLVGTLTGGNSTDTWFVHIVDITSDLGGITWDICYSNSC